jgi:hypothetical protein
MVSWWNAEDNAQDIVGGNNGTLMNGATFAPGMVGQAFSFDGVDDYVDIPNVVNGWAEGTLETWINFKDSTPKDSGDYIFAAGVAAGGTNLGIHKAAGNDLRFGIYNSGWQWAASGVEPNAGQWYHVVATWGPAGIKIYVNGVLSGTNPYTGPSYNSTYNMIGASAVAGSTVNALIDEFEIFNRALSADEIAAIYNAGSAGKCAYAVTTNSPAHGSITCNALVPSGYPAVCTITPSDGYYLSSLMDNSVPVDIETLVIDGTYTIPDVAAAHTLEAAFSEYPVRRFTTVPTGYYMTIQDAYTHAADDEEIHAQTGPFGGGLNLDRPVAVTLKGGYTSGFASNGGYTTIMGNATFSGDTITVERIVVR